MIVYLDRKIGKDEAEFEVPQYMNDWWRSPGAGRENRGVLRAERLYDAYALHVKQVYLQFVISASANNDA